MCSNCESKPNSFTPDPEDEARDMLLSSNVWVGGLVGVGSKRGMAVLKHTALVGPGCGLTRKGVAAAKKAQREYYGEA